MSVRILTHLSRCGNTSLGKFNECILETLKEASHETHCDEMMVHCQLENDKLTLRKSDNFNCPGTALLRHPPFCPLKLLSEQDCHSLPQEVKERGINVGIVAILESEDQNILLTRRARHMRTFPGVWVPPGGGPDSGEGIKDVAIRELAEETGLKIVSSDIVRNHVLCLWESVYPPFLEWGQPRRHHVVIYYHIKVNISHEVMNSNIKLQEEEVDASAWLSPKHVKLVVNGQNGIVTEDTPKTFSMKALINGKSEDIQCPSEVLHARADKNNENNARVSSGTCFALSEWLEKYVSK